MYYKTILFAMKWWQATYFSALFLWGFSVIIEGDVVYKMQGEDNFLAWGVYLNISTTPQKEVEYHSLNTSLRLYMSDEEYNTVRGHMDDLLSPAIITSEDDENDQFLDDTTSGSDTFVEPEDGRD